MRRLLLDLRESDSLRGFHVAAAVMQIAPWLPRAACHVIGGAEGDERLALELLAHDTGVAFRPWADGERVDLLLLAAERWPDDALSLQAIASARTVLFGATGFTTPRSSDASEVPAGVVCVDGHDTAVLASRTLELLHLK